MNLNDKKCLLAYYSRKGNNYINGNIENLEIGNTEIIANMIKEFIDCDLFKIDTIKEYPLDYTKTTKIAKKELNDNFRPELNDTVKNMNQYDVIILGYPNWWNTMPMAVFTFLESYNFADKIIIPYCTNEGSHLGNSITDIKKLCPNSEIKEGLSILGYNSKNSKNDVEKWLINV